MPDFPALGHVAITVTDLDASREWYRKLFGSDPIMDEDTGDFHHSVFMLGNGTIFGVHGFAKLDDTTQFSERRPGLDHISFHCADRAELEGWEKRLNDLGIKNGGVVDAPYGSGLSFRDPDNIALEFFSLPG
ncbi:MAG: VOC family protein [Acidimicrobiia bacterium]|nr:VOC family protein [Acidimicrobiia bacterium]